MNVLGVESTIHEGRGNDDFINRGENNALNFGNGVFLAEVMIL